MTRNPGAGTDLTLFVDAAQDPAGHRLRPGGYTQATIRAVEGRVGQLLATLRYAVTENGLQRVIAPAPALAASPSWSTAVIPRITFAANDDLPTTDSCTITPAGPSARPLACRGYALQPKGTCHNTNGYGSTGRR